MNNIKTITKILLESPRGLFTDTVVAATQVRDTLKDNNIEFDDDRLGPVVTRFTITETTRHALELHKETKHIFASQE